MVVDTKIKVLEAYEEYKLKAKPIVESYGGEYLRRGGGARTRASDGSYVGGTQWTQAPDGTYVGGSSWVMVPDGTYVGVD